MKRAAEPPFFTCATELSELLNRTRNINHQNSTWGTHGILYATVCVLFWLIHLRRIQTRVLNLTR